MESRSRASSTVGATVEGWVAGAGLSAAAVAHRAGVSPSTVHRVLTDQVDPAFGTLREIALACGIDLPLRSMPAADPAAAAAARARFERGYVDDSPEVAAWAARLTRYAGEDPVAVTVAAGVASGPLRQERAVLLAGDVTVGRVASAADAAGGRWALSGAAGLGLPSAWAVLPSPSILWCHDAGLVERLLTGAGLSLAPDVERTTLALVAADDALFTNAFRHGGIWFASPLQVVLDCTSVGGATAEAAQQEVETW